MPAAGQPTQAASAAPLATATAQVTASNDAFTYCASVGNIDTPAAPYSGPKMPDDVLQGLLKAVGAAPNTPTDVFVNGSVWRCMDGKVYGCYVGANLPCDEKANTDTTPTQAESDYCKANPGEDFIPAAVTGHNSIYDWQCKADQAITGKQVFHLDARGYISEIWYAVEKP
jgi:hypothetical protein